jgi:hypothetical protein
MRIEKVENKNFWGLFGDTKPYKEELKRMGLRWYDKCAKPGWTIREYQLEAVSKWLETKQQSVIQAVVQPVIQAVVIEKKPEIPMAILVEPKVEKKVHFAVNYETDYESADEEEEKPEKETVEIGTQTDDLVYSKFTGLEIMKGIIGCLKINVSGTKRKNLGGISTAEAKKLLGEYEGVYVLPVIKYASKDDKVIVG